VATKKRVCIIADLHCGHRAGLTPTTHHRPHSDDKFHKLQVELWGLFTSKIDAIKPIDILVVNGDAIDGRGVKSGSRELVEVDRNVQVKMATHAIEYAEAKHIVMTFGTGYHTGHSDDKESLIAENVKADKIGGHEFIEVNGLTFDCKHFIGNSQIPHGRGTPISREKLWNTIWAERENQPNSDVIIRSHVHHFDYIGTSRYLGMTTPALQGMGSIYGARQCSGTVDWGFVWFDVWSREEYTWKAEVVEVESQRVQVLKY
jgi:hypothetical protein